MTPKERRERLFKSGKPLVRKLELLNGDGYSKDIGVLWASYELENHNTERLNQEDFAKAVEQDLSNWGQVYVVDDKNSGFSVGKGQVALVLTNSVELLVEAQFRFFKWTTKRNILRSTVAFLNMIKNSSKTGICMVRTQGDKRILCDHLKEYDMLYFVGKTAKDEYLYSIRGRGT